VAKKRNQSMLAHQWSFLFKCKQK